MLKRFELIQADFLKESDVDRFASEVLASSGTIDVLVHNAGIFLPGDLVGENNLQAMRDMMEVNFFFPSPQSTFASKND